MTKTAPKHGMLFIVGAMMIGVSLMMAQELMEIFSRNPYVASGPLMGVGTLIVTSAVATGVFYFVLKNISD